MIKESPKIKFTKDQVLCTYKKEIESEQRNTHLTFKLVRLNEDQKEDFRGFLVGGHFNSDLLIFQRSHRVDIETGELTEFSYGVCDDLIYIHEVYEHYLNKNNFI